MRCDIHERCVTQWTTDNLNDPILYHVPTRGMLEPPRKVSGNMVHARELEITSATTVSELFELIDLPYRITKHAKVGFISQQNEATYDIKTKLRIEWRGEEE